MLGLFQEENRLFFPASQKQINIGAGDMKHHGIAKVEAEAKRVSWNHYGDWRPLRQVSLRVQPDGAIEICSYPTGRGLDLMMGSRLEVELFPDGTYSAEISPQWAMMKEGRTEGRPGTAGDGCYLYPHCEECPEPDCIAKDYMLV